MTSMQNGADARADEAPDESRGGELAHRGATVPAPTTWSVAPPSAEVVAARGTGPGRRPARREREPRPPTGHDDGADGASRSVEGRKFDRVLSVRLGTRSAARGARRVDAPERAGRGRARKPIVEVRDVSRAMARRPRAPAYRTAFADDAPSAPADGWRCRGTVARSRAAAGGSRRCEGRMTAARGDVLVAVRRTAPERGHARVGAGARTPARRRDRALAGAPRRPIVYRSSAKLRAFIDALARPTVTQRRSEATCSRNERPRHPAATPDRVRQLKGWAVPSCPRRMGRPRRSPRQKTHLPRSSDDSLLVAARARQAPPRVWHPGAPRAPGRAWTTATCPSTHDAGRHDFDRRGFDAGRRHARRRRVYA